jgi:hypothetical protein
MPHGFYGPAEIGASLRLDPVACVAIWGHDPIEGGAIPDVSVANQ